MNSPPQNYYLYFDLRYASLIEVNILRFQPGLSFVCLVIKSNNN